MIYDHLFHLSRYVPKYKMEIEEFLSKVSPDMPIGNYEIAGKDVYAMVHSYSLKPAESVKVEAHNRYVDIQSVICGHEGIDVFVRNQLTVDVPYDSEKDVELLKPGDMVASLYVPEGYFAMLFPTDAHRPQMFVRDTKEVRKFVIKMDIHLFEQ